MTANHPEDLVARPLGEVELLIDDACSLALGYGMIGRPDLMADYVIAKAKAIDAVTSLVGERDALRTALTRLLSHYDSVARDLGIEPDAQDVVITSRALASPHQEGTET